MAVLPDTWLHVMNVLLEAPVAWRSPAEIAATLGRGDGELTDLLCDLDVAGWLAVWETDAGPLVTLSALAARRLGARLVEVGAGETPRWARAGDPDPPRPRAKHVCLSERAASLEFVPDPDLSPDLAAERGEHAEARARANHQSPAREARHEESPRPTVLVGLSLTPWPGPRSPSEGVCPACGDRTLGPQMYCLYCDRWGLDRLTPGDPLPPPASVVLPPRRARAAAADSATAEKAQAERLRARRKSKRHARHLARLEAERQRTPKPQPVAARPEPPTTFVPLYCPPPGMPRSQNKGH